MTRGIFDPLIVIEVSLEIIVWIGVNFDNTLEFKDDIIHFQTI